MGKPDLGVGSSGTQEEEEEEGGKRRRRGKAFTLPSLEQSLGGKGKGDLTSWYGIQHALTYNGTRITICLLGRIELMHSIIVK